MITEIGLGVAIIFLLALEAWAGIDKGPNSPWITTVIRSYVKRYPALAFAAGFIAGHLLWGG